DYYCQVWDSISKVLF
nr:immunoglobulin light chain junction region [Macaca mulatta]MOV99938.1 immunoglobulin light chain junction region [Macaca mulatta]